MQSSRSLVSRFLLQNVRRYKTSTSDTLREPHFNELPVPQGSWQEAYDAKNRKHTATLIFGIVFAAATIFTGKTTGLIYLNAYPPESLD